MIQHTQLLRIGKMKGGGIILAAARHNLREIQAERGADSHIDPLKTVQNIILRGADNAADVASLAVQLMEQGNAKRRKDEVLGLEVIASLRPASGIDERAFFEAAVTWADGFFEIPILSAVIHNDEAAPHCHIVMLPLFDGRMIGSKLVGNKERLAAMQADFFEKVGQPFGLTRPTKARRFSHAARVKMAERAVSRLAKHPKDLNEPVVCDALRDVLAASDNPAPLMEALGLDMPESKPPKVKPFVARVKPEKPIGFKRLGHVKPIGFTAVADTPKEQSLSCVGFVDNPLTVEPANVTFEDDLQNDYSRESDDDLAGKVWDEVRGEFVTFPASIKPKPKEVERMRGVIQSMQR
jgi:Plasmid recombination enzyme